MLAGIAGLTTAGLGVAGCGSQSRTTAAGIGPNGMARNAAAATTAPAVTAAPAAPSVLWRHEIASGLAGLVAADGVVCTGITSGGMTDASGVYAMDAATGEQAWTHRGEEAVIPWAAGSGMVYCAATGGVAALSSSTGKVAWMSGAGALGSMPLVYADGAVYAAFLETTGNVIAAFDGETGHRQWSTTTPQPVTALAAADGAVYLGWANSMTSGELTALDAATGAHRWTTSLGTIPGQLAITSGVVAVSTSAQTGQPKTFATVALDSKAGRILWREPNAGAQTLAAGGGVVCTSPAPLAARHARTGKRIWQRTDAQDQARQLIMADGLLYADRFPPLRVLSAATGQPLWGYADSAPPGSHAEQSFMAVADGVVFAAFTDVQHSNSGWAYAVRN